MVGMLMQAGGRVDIDIAFQRFSPLVNPPQRRGIGEQRSTADESDSQAAHAGRVNHPVEKINQEIVGW